MFRPTVNILKGFHSKQSSQHVVSRLCSSTTTNEYNYETLKVTTPKENVYHVMINRGKKLNSMNKDFWREIGECFHQLSDDTECRAVVLSGDGRIFTSGLDFNDLADMAGVVTSDEDIARKCKQLKHLIRRYQDSFTSLEKCSKPVIAAVHNACVGGGVDLVCAADIRYCTADAWFQIKEVDIGMAADVGTLQRLPKILGSDSLARELVYSARKLYSDEALQCGLISRIFSDKTSLLAGAFDMAELIASKSPVAVQNSKAVLIHSRDHSVDESLEYQAVINMSMLQSEDVRKAAMGMMNKEKVTFAKL